jgi:hypothetical protein
MCHEKGGTEVTQKKVGFPQHWYFVDLISNPVTHPERASMRLISAPGAVECGGSCLGDMEAQLRRREEKYQTPTGQRNAGSEGTRPSHRPPPRSSFKPSHCKKFHEVGATHCPTPPASPSHFPLSFFFFADLGFKPRS